MAEAEQQGGAAAFIRDAPMLVVLEIVRRLPTRSAIRVRAVCRAWRDITSHPALLAVLHRLQPPRPLLCFGRTACPDRRYVQLRDYCVEALDLRSHQLRSVFRFTDNMYCGYFRLRAEVPHIAADAVDYEDYEYEDDDEFFCPRLTVHASLDGLLLVSFRNAWYVCNPTTRQWAAIAVDLRFCDVIGLYEHVSSGEYRVLYHTGKDDEDASTCYFVLKVGSRDSRSIGCPISPAAEEDMGLADGLDPSRLSPPVQLRCNLHWPPQERQGYRILVFDTEAELFSWMSPPVRDKDMRLLEIEGKLAVSVSRKNKETLQLWRLEDYRNEIWVQVFRIRLAVEYLTDLYFEDWSSSVVSPQGDVLIEFPHWVLHCDRNGNLLKKFWLPDEAASARHALRESLLSHAIFLAPKADDARKPVFFSGL